MAFTTVYFIEILHTQQERQRFSDRRGSQKCFLLDDDNRKHLKENEITASFGKKCSLVLAFRADAAFYKRQKCNYVCRSNLSVVQVLS